MNGLDADGLFWLADKPDKRVAGHLKTGGRQGAELALIGAFGDRSNLRFENSAPLRILGQVGNGAVTLESCLLTNLSRNMTGIVSEAYHVPIVLDGAHFEKHELLTFKGFQLQLWHLNHWAGISKISVRYDYSPEGDLNLIIACPTPTTVATYTDFRKARV